LSLTQCNIRSGLPDISTKSFNI